MKWYAVHVTTNHENKVRKHLEKRRLNDLAGRIGEIFIPEKEGKPVMPGYIFLQSDIWPDVYLPRDNSRCMTIGAITEKEIEKFRPQKKRVFKKGDKVMITFGPMAGKQGVVVTPGNKKSRISYLNGGVKIDVDNKLLRIYEEDA
ncbi:MAG: hypothetical protein K6T65_10240 [Peptococcaceae bacterium]|nr:hypothetical protein [Peptococcaceae bacterium]